MKQFKWKGIPVNIPDKKIEWQLLMGFIFLELFIITILIITYKNR